MTTRFTMGETLSDQTDGVRTVLLGASLGAAFSARDYGKAVKLVGAGRYDLCAVDDLIEGFIVAAETFTEGGYCVGSVRNEGYKLAKLSGAAAIGDYVAAAAQPAIGTAVDSGGTYPLVKKAAVQADAKAAPFKWRIIDGNPVDGGIVLLEDFS